MTAEEQILERCGEWANEDAAIRAVVLTGSRANPEAPVDALSDYDIELLVQDRASFENDDDWLAAFGTPLVRWPRKPEATFDDNWLTRLVVFENGTRIDFQITDNSDMYPHCIDYGYRVLYDRDGILNSLPKPAFSRYNILKPSADDFTDLVNAFFWDALYVPKYLKRNQTAAARQFLEESLRTSFLHRMLDWQIGMRYGWNVDSGKFGSRYRELLEPEIWNRYEATCPTLDSADIWEAFFQCFDLFTDLARAVADGLSYPYPECLEKKIRAKCIFIREML